MVKEQAKPNTWLNRVAKRRGLHRLGLKSYDDYLATEHWQSFRKLVLEDQRKRLQRNACEQCSSGDIKLHVHHLTYDRLGNELITDCLVVCEPCHKKMHGHDAPRRSGNWAPGYY